MMWNDSTWKKIITSFYLLLFVAQAFQVEAAFTASDMPIVDGKVYHLSLTPEQLAPNIILVGDPDRVPLLAKHCLARKGRTKVFHRGLCTITGTTKTGLPISIVTSGMGTPSAEIVLNELVILNEIDLQTRERRATPLHKTLNIIRLGTSGGLQAATELGTLIITEYAVGLDNTGLFYSADEKVDLTVAKLERVFDEKLNDSIDEQSRFYNTIRPYAAPASPVVVQALYDAAMEKNISVVKGITVSNSGFFANQGRDISRLHITVPDIDGICADITVDSLKVENMEMEASFMCYFIGSLGYNVGAICTTVCNRRFDTFYEGSYEDRVLDALKIIIKAFEKLQN